MWRNKVYAYPNPALSGVFWLKDFVAPVDVQVFDATGQQVPIQLVLNDEQVQVKLVNGSTGNYFVWIHDGAGESLLKLQITYEQNKITYLDRTSITSSVLFYQTYKRGIFGFGRFL
jgi:hypothetical protein